MLSREVMGALALAILWVNALLIAAAAGKALLGLVRRRARMVDLAGEGIGLVHGRVVHAEGPDRTLAAVRVEQVGRAAAGDESIIVYSDRSAAGEAFGGRLSLSGGREVEVEAGPAEVWVGAFDLAQAGACPSAAAFDAAYEGARKARGASRTVTAGIAVEREVFVLGHLKTSGERARLSPALSHEGTTSGRSPVGPEGSMLIATMDPRALLGRKILIAGSFIVAELSIAAGCTVLALSAPPFGPISTVGAALGLAFFLLVQPAGTLIRDAVRVPSRALLGGRWVRPEERASLALHQS